jgi:hypothetical protein
MKSCFSLTLDTVLGNDIVDCCNKAVEIANLLGISVRFNFNGVVCYAKPFTSPDRLVDAYHEALKLKKSMATSFT